MRKPNLLASISIAALAATSIVGEAQAQVTTEEAIAFQMAMNQGDIDQMMDFLRDYPTSPFAQTVVNEVVETVGAETASEMVAEAQNGAGSESSIY